MSDPLLIPAKWALPGGRLVLGANAARESWLAQRRTLVGGSDVAALLNVSSYGDPLTLWADKTGRSSDDPPNLAMLRGQIFEDAVIALWAQHVAPFTIETRRAGLVRSRVYPHVGATVDRLSACNMGGTLSRCVVEAKTVSDVSEWEDDEVPVGFQLQGGMQLLATGRDHVHYVGMGPRWQPLHRVIQRDEAFLAQLGQRVEQWWADHVTADVAPSATRRSIDTLRALNPGGDAVKVREIDDELAPHVHALINARRDVTALDMIVKEATAVIMQAMGDCTELRWPDEPPNAKPVATWRRGKTVDGANADWQRAHPELVERYSIPTTEFVVAKAVADDPSLIGAGGLRYRRTFSVKD